MFHSQGKEFDMRNFHAQIDNMSKTRGETLTKHPNKPDNTKTECEETRSDSFNDGQSRS